VLLIVFALVPAASARAQGFVSPLVGYNFGGDAGCPEITDCDDKNLNFGVALGSMGRVLGYELEFAYAQDFFGETPGISSDVLTVMSNVMFVPNLGPARPYVFGGVGLIKTNVDLTLPSVLSTNNNSFGWDIGGGLMIFFADHVGVRGDIRYFHTFTDLEFAGVPFVIGEKLDFGRVSGSVVFKF
jgi:opacity protein-like surface antigen